MNVLVDYNLAGYVVLFQGTLAAEGWLDLLSIRFVTLQEAGLAADTDTNDRIIWQFWLSENIGSNVAHVWLILALPESLKKLGIFM